MSLISQFLDKFRTKKQQNHTFNDLDRDKSEIARAQNAIQKLQLEAKKTQLKRLKQKLELQLMDDEIADLEDDLYGDDEEIEEKGSFDSDTIMAAVIGNLMGGKGVSPLSPQTTPAPQQPLTEEVSDEEIQGMISQIPQDKLKIIKKTPVQILRPLAKEHFPGVSEQTIERAIEIIKNG